MSLHVEVSKEFVFNSIAMDNTRSDVNIIVEGATDASLLFDFTDESCCNIYYLKTRDKVLELMKELEDAGKVDNTVAIVDKDQEDVYPQTQLPSHTFYTDTNDIETMILVSDSFYRIASQLFPSSKCPDRAAIEGIRQLLIDRALPIGELRIIDKRHQWNLSFKDSGGKKDVEFKKFIKRQNFDYLGDDTLVNTIKGHNHRPEINTDQVLAELEQLRQEGHSHTEIIVGHDISRIIALALKQYMTKAETASFDKEQVEVAFRLGYQKEHFIGSQLGQSILQATNHLDINFFAL